MVKTSPAIVRNFAICITLNLMVHQVDVITAMDGGGFLVYMHNSNLTRAILQAAEKFLRAKTIGTALESKRHSILQKSRFHAVEKRVYINHFLLLLNSTIILGALKTALSNKYKPKTWKR